jgi:hypothetical protein
MADEEKILKEIITSQNYKKNVNIVKMKEYYYDFRSLITFDYLDFSQRMMIILIKLCFIFLSIICYIFYRFLGRNRYLAYSKNFCETKMYNKFGIYVFMKNLIIFFKD